MRKHLLGGVLVGLFWVALVSWELPGIGGPYRRGDWAQVFYEASLRVMRGEVPYLAVPLAFHPIHLYALLGWTIPFGAHWSWSVWIAATMAGTLAALWVLARRTPWAVVPVMFSLPMAFVVVNGQVTALTVVALALVWQAFQRREDALRLGVSYTLLRATPPNTIPVALWVAARSFGRSRREFFRSLMVPLVVLGASFLAYGWWVRDFIVAFRGAVDSVETPANLAIWGQVEPPWLPLALVAVGVALTWRYRQRLEAADWRLQLRYFKSLTCLLTPYLLEHRLFPTFLLACVVLAERRRGWLPMLWLLAASPLLVSHWLAFYSLPLVAYGATIYHLGNPSGSEG